MQPIKLVYVESIIDVFTNEVNKFGLVETGGVLLGYKKKDFIVITKAIGPGPNAVHEDFYFRADKHYIDMRIDIEYANSGGEIVYLGEWHTHPEVVPNPSEVDLNSLKEIADSSGSLSLLLVLGAVGFSKSKFIENSISILKSPEENLFFKLSPVVAVSTI
ncbi:MAG: Mov34/MPN/PAD-1 family protein [Imperialibacter sp.]